MRTGKDAGVAKILIESDSPQRDRRGAPGRPVEDRKHAGMGALVDPRHVITCAHVVNVALEEAKNNTRKPTRLVRVVFPLSADPSVVTAQVVEWYPVGNKSIADVAVLEFDEDAPADVGITVFGLIRYCCASIARSRKRPRRWKQTARTRALRASPLFNSAVVWSGAGVPASPASPA
jgi:hypothetical protein